MSPSISSDALLPDIGQYLTFQAAGESFAIGILSIKEILEYARLTTVPQMPAFVCGVMNLRGTVVPVIDLAQRLARAPTQPGRRSCIVIVEVRSEEQIQYIGVLVDVVHEVLGIADVDMLPAPAFGSRLRADFIKHMARTAKGFVVVLDIDKALSIDEMALLSQQAGREPADSLGMMD
ncbi:chemotaxis protein CheW [uncultured Aquitalea sp.]|uniref:chemotaxis protein CheW n=1 Tax=uncultured Aquitalea sp. TaxID=540272 RepID=UPI0025FDEE78|nr:chemotaxis protein CheW [uncultured Aquitalea sp.]